MATDPETLEKLDLYRNDGTGKFIARDPDTDNTYPFPFEKIEASELTDGVDNVITDFAGSNLNISSGTLNAGSAFTTRVDVTSTSTTLSPADSAWVDTSAAGAAVTITLPADADTSDGDRVEVGIENATNDTDVTANSGQSIIGNNPTLTNNGDTLTFEFKSSTSTWMVK